MNTLVADIGGTHCRLAAAHTTAGRVILEDVQRYQNAQHPDLASVLGTYLARHPECNTACLAVAGPTDGRHVQFTNLAWDIDAAALEKGLGLARVHLINDFSAVGWGLNALQPPDLSFLQAGSPAPQGVKAAVGAGTGLGVCIGIRHDDGRHHPLPTEGGHVGFAPLDEVQDRLLRFMRGLYGRVSVERLLSGPGIVDLYRFCLSEAGSHEDADPLLAATVPAQAISEAGMAAESASAVRCMSLFAGIYGQVAGDVALLTRAQGGIYLAGGIAAKVLPVLQGPEFLAGFHAKGRFRDWMRTVPVAVVLDPDIGLKGAALAGD